MSLRVRRVGNWIRSSGSPTVSFFLPQKPKVPVLVFLPVPGPSPLVNTFLSRQRGGDSETSPRPTQSRLLRGPVRVHRGLSYDGLREDRYLHRTFLSVPDLFGHTRLVLAPTVYVPVSWRTSCTDVPPHLQRGVFGKPLVFCLTRHPPTPEGVNTLTS